MRIERYYRQFTNACGRCGSENLSMVAMGDGYDIGTGEALHTYTYNCECGNVVTVEVRKSMIGGDNVDTDLRRE